MAEKFSIFGNGIPTEPDVKKLRDTFGVPAVGQEIPYSAIEAAIGVNRKTHRWATVTNAWRKALDREHNVLMDAIPNVGFRVMDPSERVVFSASTYKGGLRRIARAGNVAERTDVKGLKPEELRVRDHISRAAASLRLAAATQARELNAPTR